jgi:hypothetical protein
MISVKSTKETENTFTITFNISTLNELCRRSDRLNEVRALAVALGDFNQQKKYMKDADKVLEIKEQLDDDCLVNNLISELRKYIL